MDQLDVFSTEKFLWQFQKLYMQSKLIVRLRTPSFLISLGKFLLKSVFNQEAVLKQSSAHRLLKWLSLSEFKSCLLQNTLAAEGYTSAGSSAH